MGFPCCGLCGKKTTSRDPNKGILNIMRQNKDTLDQVTNIIIYEELITNESIDIWDILFFHMEHFENAF